MSAQQAPPENGVLTARALHYAHDGSPALLGFSLCVRPGEIVEVTGPRGAGKSTLLGCLSGRLLPDTGEVCFDGMPLHTLPPSAREQLRLERFGWIGSSPELLPELTAWENAALPLLLAGTGHRAARARAVEWLDRLDIGDCARRRPADLPQAVRQRVAVARALVHKPSVVLADEPTAPLHSDDRAQVLRTLTSAARSHGIAVVLTAPERPVGGSGPANVPPADRTVTLVDGRGADAPGAAPGTEDRSACSLSA
ncbi:ATP-binding cassette domain-containing protein [Streptomyces sp. 549]|uniref:ABC transporter ATP-binding protein n=1 Tax=Streptomyces sp. 549 TaxID=3049076 RepID=UPI0024C2E268|nr:ATP-binding cassette domain-containing protein [Streptomyces sp. 549]MDK1475124.1 ATP-binding cassette domain-containing protein [Streptomyces sp. 549]